MTTNFAVFSTQLRTGYQPVPGSTMVQPIYTPCLTLVTESKSSRGYGFVVFSIDHRASKSVIVYAQSNARFLTNEMKTLLSKLCTPDRVKPYQVVTDPNVNLSLSKNDLFVIQKLDNLFFANVFIDADSLIVNI